MRRFVSATGIYFILAFSAISGQAEEESDLEKRVQELEKRQAELYHSLREKKRTWA